VIGSKLQRLRRLLQLQGAAIAASNHLLSPPWPFRCVDHPLWFSGAQISNFGE
jgi:hypothetical protein